MFGAEEPFKGREIVVAMLMRVLKLMNVPSLREVLLIDVFVSLQPAHALEDSAIRFVNFHRLNLLVAIKSVFYFGGGPIGLIINAWMSSRMMQGWDEVEHQQLLVCKLLHSKLMDLGSAFAVFFAVTIVIMVLFCLLLKYFSYRRKRIIRQNEVECSLNDELFKQAEEVHDGAYDEFCSRRKEEKGSTSRKKLVEEDLLIEMGDLKQVLKVSNNIYGMGNLRKRLNSDTLPLTTLATETNRSISQSKEFNLERLSTQQSHKSDRKYHQFVKKLVRYSARGLSIFEANVTCLKMESDGIVLDKKVEENVILQDEQTFEDLLEINGYEKCNFGYYKYTCSVDITNVKEGSSYPFKVMKSTQSKETITEEEYFKWLQIMHSSK